MYLPLGHGRHHEWELVLDGVGRLNKGSIKKYTNDENCLQMSKHTIFKTLALLAPSQQLTTKTGGTCQEHGGSSCWLLVCCTLTK